MSEGYQVESESHPPQDPRRKFQVQPIVTQGLHNTEKLLAYFPQLSGTPRSATGTPTAASNVSPRPGLIRIRSGAGTPTAASSAISHHSLHRIRSMSPTDMREDNSSVSPQALLRRKLKMPMTNQQPNTVKEQFLTFDSADAMDASSVDKGIDLHLIRRLEDLGRDDSLASMDTSQADDKSSATDSPLTSLSRKLMVKQSSTDSPLIPIQEFGDKDTDDSPTLQKYRNFYQQKYQEDLLTSTQDDGDSK